MFSPDQAKSMAKRLRVALAADAVEVSHARALELIAASFGFVDWNTAVASLTRGGPEAIAFTGCSPILRIFDEAKAREFYCGFLGFTVAFEHRHAADLPLYLAVERAGLQLHLSEHHNDVSPGANAFIPTTNLRALHAEVTARNYPFNRPGLEKLPWGLQMQVHDPFGNRLRFCEQGS
ncbi:glyoxalase superfamily protein [Pararhodobacter oceanensis]|uniref:glyoxalase superfamily protein n=1 Tax=Pararhodobacter oceanensis TaxID=2172121 RepID=UPI003A8F80B8